MQYKDRQKNLDKNVTFSVKLWIRKSNVTFESKN